MNSDLPKPTLGLTEAEAETEFDRLQKKLVPLWRSIQSFNQDEQTIVVVPSLTIDFDCSSAELQAYEERFLFLLLLLRQPRARLIYVTSQMIHPNIVDYYLDLLPGVIASHARKRLFLVSPLDASTRPLSLKLLERPRLIEYLRSLIIDFDRAHLVPYNTTTLERDLAIRLGIPMYGADPKTFWIGTKSGSRKMFADEGVAHPLGIENLASIDDVARAIAEMRRQKPALRQVLVKLNEGVSGEGNALVDLEGLTFPGTSEHDVILQRLQSMKFELQGVTYDEYVKKLNERGGIVEERIQGEEFRSPSAQMRITPLGQVERLSTHDQVLGGASGQTYLGCRFPADPAYAGAIMREASKVGARLAREGVVGRFAIDFVTVREQNEWKAYAIEINLRKGGTTHPFLTLQFLTDGAYDADHGVFRTALGHEKCFVASDHQDSPLYRVFTPDDLFDIVARHNIHFDQTRQSGVVFHMMSALGSHGRVGLTAVGNNREEADALFAKAVSVLDQEAQTALEQRAAAAG
ncbi:MAG TPA: peptide ligase PGM1-related protein [Pyrinomonadaceae bacterium]|nr:peptide ligase PGM1-related protein [Pyrinomonadaceae bacterium]